MHTNMQAQDMDKGHIQRCRNVWWTVYILDRNMSSTLGVPLAIRDEEISAALPTFSGSPQKGLALELNVKLSRIISQILNSKSKHLAICLRNGNLTPFFLSCLWQGRATVEEIHFQHQGCLQGNCWSHRSAEGII